jgi:hypothetical protein
MRFTVSHALLTLALGAALGAPPPAPPQTPNSINPHH